MTERGTTRPPIGVPSILTGAFYALVVLLSFLQQPGRTTYDTRIELTEDPGAFLRSAFSLWHPDVTMGEIQNQAYGYLFPQGPFFWVADLLSVPGWVTQRAWSALVLIVAAEGARRVALRLGLSPAGALLAAIAFAFSPRLLGTVGVISAESLPGAVMPWALLPVVIALQGGLSTRRAALLSAAAVVCMGGVNAVEVVGSLPIVLIFILWGIRQRLASWSLLAWWGGSVLVATLWWLLPLVVLGRYSPPFFDYVEDATSTTSLVGWLEATRGASHWLSYVVVGDRAWWPAAHEYAAADWLVVLTSLVSALGLLGLVRWQHPMRTPLVLSAALGLLALTVAHGTWVGSPVGDVVRDLLDGPLAAFRNIHKIDPVVRLPLAIGLGALAQQAATRVPTVPHLLAGALVLTLAQPMLMNQGRTDGWTELPDDWQRAAAYLQEHDDGRTTWVVPGAGFAVQDWGRTLDEPLRAVAGVRWASRSQIPLAPGQTIRALDGIEQLIANGSGSAELGNVLARMGIGHVLLRRDLDRSQAESPDPAYAARALATSGGLRRVDGFDDTIVLYDVVPVQPRARLTDLSEVETVQGGPEDVARAANDGLLSSVPSVLAGEHDWDADAAVVTDGNQRRERAYGRVYDSLGPVLAATEPYIGDRLVANYPGADDAKTVLAQYDGADRVTASSSQGYVNVLGAVLPEVGPYSAVDDSLSSSWVSSVIEKPVGQWLQVDFDEPRSIGSVSVTAKVTDPALVPASRLRFEAGNVSRAVAVNPSTGVASADLDVEEARSLRITVAEVTGGDDAGPVAIPDVAIDGVHIGRTLLVPEVAQTAAPAYLFGTAAEPRACFPAAKGYTCDPRRERGAEEADGLDRTVTVPGGTTWQLTGTVVARARPGTSVLLDPLGESQVVRASTTLGQDPAAGPRAAYDGDRDTAWRSAALDPAPRLIVGWDRPRTIRGVTVAASGDGAPTSVTVTSDEGTRTVDLIDGSGRFRRLTTRRAVISFEGFRGDRGVSVSEIDLVGVPSFIRPVDRDDPTGSVCGLGPEIEVDGATYPTEVSGTFGDLLDGDPLTLTACGEPVDLTSGEHRIHAVPTDQFQVVTLELRPDGVETPSTTTTGPRVLSWSDARRSVEVTGGGGLLSMPENFNIGWKATLDGKELPAVRVDGWQQGFIVPSGATGVVTMTYAPQSLYLVLLLVGLALAGLVVLGAAATLFLQSRGDASQRQPRQAPRPTRATWRGPAAVVVGSVVVAGPVVAVGLALGTLRRSIAPYAGAGLVVAAGVVSAAAAGEGWNLTAEAMCAAGVGLLAGSLLSVPWGRRHHE